MQDSPMPDLCRQTLDEALHPALFRALSDPQRISIVATLAARPEAASVSDIAECCGIDFSGVSRHLKALREAGVLSARREGRSVLYHLNVDELADSLQGIAIALKQCRAKAG